MNDVTNIIDYSEQFDKERKYRVEVSHHKYGSAREYFGEGRVDVNGRIK